ncbi:MAG: HU family DNA-binding protein [Candidatus Wallbacteria bacterium]|nr:HU family DNA-binding protein [Candidatus Wallbacteria bacterium]
MKLADLSAQVAVNLDISVDLALRAIQETFLIIEKEVKKGGSVVIPDFGSFEVLTISERRFKDEKNGEVRVQPEVSVPLFKYAGSIREWFFGVVKRD